MYFKARFIDRTRERDEKSAQNRQDLPRLHSLKNHLSSAGTTGASPGIRSTPIQKRGGNGRRSSSSCAAVAGSVKGSGIDPPRSMEEQDEKSRAIPATVIRVAFIKERFSSSLECVEKF